MQESAPSRGRFVAAGFADVRPWLSVAFLVAAALLILDSDLWYRSWLVLLLLWASVAAQFAPPWSALIFAAGLGLDWALAQASAYKVALNGMPITMLDLKITAGNSAVLWYLFDVPQWTRYAFILCVLGLVAYALYRAVRNRGTSSLLAVAAWSAALLALLVWYEIRLGQDVKSHLVVSQASKHRNPGVMEIWAPEQVAEVAGTIGPIPFLLYSWRLERESGSPLFDAHAATEPVGSGAISRAAAQFITPIGGMRPNIVLVQLESMFDPNRAFELAAPLANFLFERNGDTHYLLPMRVNIVGGGSWVSEFEVLTGLDYRLFGYSGYYTHATVGTYVDGAFPDYLRRRGYRTNVFYTDGEFYNARNAYARYGFDDFWDHNQLELSDPWHPRDTEMAANFVKRSHDFDTQPFFSFIDTNGAHSPYPCRHFKSPEAFRLKFRGPATVKMNCALNEYVLRAEDSAEAVKSLLARLEEIEKSTGRPFVLMVYGDHQPHAFTGTQIFMNEFNPVRSEASKSQTFVHVMSSLPRGQIQIDREVPATLLPTILSSFVAGRTDDLYMPVNTYLFEACGPDLYRSARSAGVFGVVKEDGVEPSLSARASDAAPASEEACATAQQRTIAWLRGPSGILTAGTLRPR